MQFEPDHPEGQLVPRKVNNPRILTQIQIVLQNPNSVENPYYLVN
jgi:hypothetical protein